MTKEKPKEDYSGLDDIERAIYRGFLYAGAQNVPVGIIKDTANEVAGIIFRKLIINSDKL